MKVIGLIGGMSWESSAMYYRIINEEVKKRLGSLHSAKCLLYSVDFAEIEQLQRNDEWEKAGYILGDVARSLEKGGADFIVICTNTMHKVIDIIQAKINIPILHIADATVKQIKKQNITKIGLLGTSYTMEQDFYTSRIASSGIDVIVPTKMERKIINKIIFEELCVGKINIESRDYYRSVIHNLTQSGVEGIILGCTEIELLIKQDDAQIPLFNTTNIHAQEAVNKSLNE